MNPDPHSHRPLAGSGPGDPAGVTPTRPGQLCWLCGHAIIDPPHIIGQAHAGRVRAAHRYCLRVLGELDLGLGRPTA